MESAYLIASVWLALAVASTILANHLRISMALSEIFVGIAAGAFISRLFGVDALGTDEPWLKFIAGSGAIMLTFLAGAELDPAVVLPRWREVLSVGMVGFLAPFLGIAALAHYGFHWDIRPALLAGVALSTTSVAVVYAVMYELGLNKTEFGKGILGSCFVNDLGTVLGLGILFAPFNWRTAVFIAASILVLVLLPIVTRFLTAKYGNRTAAIRTKWILFVLFSLGALALWSGSEAVLPAYLAGMILANTVSADEFFIRRLRTLTVGFLTPFYFLRAGMLVSLPAVLAAPVLFIGFLLGKVAAKIFGLYPLIALFSAKPKERWYYTLMMSTGLTFGTISALYGLSNDIINKSQYSVLVAVVIGSALIPTMIANAIFLPRHLLPIPAANTTEVQTTLVTETVADSADSGGSILRL